MNKNFYFVIIGITLWISETAFFGWNDKPINGMERVLDVISWLLIFWGIIGDISSGLTYKKQYKIKADTVIIKNKEQKDEVEKSCL